MTQNIKHTPGPWTAHRNSSFWEFGNYDHEHGQIGDVCASQHIYANGVKLSDGIAEDVAEANAKLIAAAPEMLEALKNIRNAIRTGAVKIVTDQDEAWENAMIKANQVIAKATGEQS